MLQVCCESTAERRENIPGGGRLAYEVGFVHREIVVTPLKETNLGMGPRLKTGLESLREIEPKD